MPRPRLSLLGTWRLPAQQAQSRAAVRHGRLLRIPVRACSCSAPARGKESPGFSSPASQQRAALNTTSRDPPTPPADHRALAHSHDLFTTSPYSPGSPLFLPNGAYMFHKLQAFLRAQYPLFGYQEVITPNIYKKSLWEASGHWDNYADDMFSVQGRGATGQTDEAELGQDEEFGLKPMNCPGHCLLFGSQIRSYRDLPVRLADFSALHRNEISGALTGLTRVRRFHQDDAHIFCRQDQILSEIEQTLKFVGLVYDTFGLGPYKLRLSTRPQDHYIGTLEEWDRAEQQLTSALNNSGREWDLNEGDGAFYGPKIDIILRDANGKDHQTATIQLDFQLPHRFDLQYQASPEELDAGPPLEAGALDITHRRPVIVHRAIYGSLERFMALLIEHYAGRFPFWLSPRPAIILSLNQFPAVLEHVAKLQSYLSGIEKPANASSQIKPQPLSAIQLPIAVDTSARSISKKIAEAQSQGYNHIIVVGNNEAADDSLNLQIAKQPYEESTEHLLSQTLGRDLEDRDRKRGRINIALQPSQAKKYFENLVHNYL